MNKTRVLVTCAFIVVALVGLYVTLPALERSAEQTTARHLVERFGAQLQNVSLLASSTGLAQSFDTVYGEYVAPSLLDQWKMHTTLAVGREALSPWPDRIEVASVIRTDPGEYRVEGTVVEVTGAGLAPAATYPVHIVVTKVEGKWLIVSLEKGTYSALPQTETIRGVYGCAPHRVGPPVAVSECIPDITRADTNEHVVLDLSLVGSTTTRLLTSGVTVEATGLVVPISQINSDTWKAYDVVGIMQVSAVQKI